MTIRQDITAYWGKSGLHRARQQDVKGLTIPEHSRKFLLEVGVPTQLRAATQALGIQLGPSREIDYLASTLESRCRLLGQSFEAQICLREPDGAVVLVEGNGPLTFLNSSVEQFVAFLRVYEHSTGQGNGLDRDALASLVKELKGKYRTIDPVPFKDPNGWWPVILEELGV